MVCIRLMLVTVSLNWARLPSGPMERERVTVPTKLFPGRDKENSSITHSGPIETQMRQTDTCIALEVEQSNTRTGVTTNTRSRPTRTRGSDTDLPWPFRLGVGSHVCQCQRRHAP